MNDTSIRSVSLTQKPRPWSTVQLAKQALRRVFKEIEVGSLTLYDGNDTHSYGDTTQTGVPHAQVRVHNPQMYSDVLTTGSIGAGEAYMRGYWTSPDLVAVIRLLCVNMATLQSMDTRKSWLKALALKLTHLLNQNTLQIGRAHV